MSLTWTTAFESIGQVTQHLGDSLRFLLRGRWGWRQALFQAGGIGYDSLGVVLVINFIAGSVLSLQSAVRFAQTGAETYVGGLVALAIVREIAPTFTSLAVGARAGTAMAAELAHMTISNQVAALQMMHVHPVRYLMVPRLLACLISLPMLTMVAQVVGTLGGMLIAWQVASLHPNLYLESVWLTITPRDVWLSLAKAAIFAVLMAGICCTVGLTTRGGAREVGQSTTRAAVWTAIAMVIADFFLTWLFFA